MPRDYTNKLSIYLIKDEFIDDRHIIKNIDSLNVEEIRNIGKIYYGQSHMFAPSWLRKFFREYFFNQGENDTLKIYSASAKALLLVRVLGRMFAVIFGYGKSFLNPGVYEERFGLKVVVNIIDPDNIRSIDKKNMSITPKIVTESMTKKGSMADFGIDVEQDLLQGMTGKSKFEEFGKTITGKDALSLSVKINASNIKDFLKLCYEKYCSDDYKTRFEWIDHIAEIKSPKVISELNGKLIEKIKNSDDSGKIWMSIPNIVPWERIAEFRIESSKASLGDDIYMENFIKLLDQELRENLSLDIFKAESIECISADNDEQIDCWKAYNCLCAEITENNKTHILSNGKWYEIEGSYAKKVNEYFENIRNTPPLIELPKSQIGEHEDKYNERIASKFPTMCCMDRKNISLGGVRGPIEFCDLLTDDKKIIHVKRYGASRVLSHLFSQGLVSADLFLSEPDFRNKVRAILPTSHKKIVPTSNPDPKDYTIIYAIISRSNKLIDIPFFSKVNLRNVMKRLQGSFRYNVSFLAIDTEK